MNRTNNENIIKQSCINCISKSDLFVIIKSKNIRYTSKMNKKQLYELVYDNIFRCDKHILQLEEEEWKKLYESLNNQNYLISNFGRLKNIKRNVIILGYINSAGYRIYSLGSKKKKYFAHILVALTFIENFKCKKFVDHIDRNKINNKIDNLRWVTSKENNNNRNIHKNHGKKRKINQYDLNDNFIKTWDSMTSASKFCNIKYSYNIEKVCKGTLKSFGGYIWKYFEDKQIEGEVWKKIPLNTKYEYQISNKGRIRNNNKKRNLKGTMF